MNAQPTSDFCLNCGGPVQSHFCAACGQRNRDLRASLSHLISEMANEAFELDSRIRETLSPFLFRPGQLTKEYNAGRRMKYSSPLLALDGEGQREMSARIQAEFVNALPKMVFLLLPLFALILKALYWRRFYVEHVVFAFHLHAFAFLALIPAALIGSTWFTLTVIMLVLAYLLVGMRNVYEGSWSLTLFKFVLLVIPYGFFEVVGLSAASLASFFTA